MIPTTRLSLKVKFNLCKFIMCKHFGGLLDEIGEREAKAVRTGREGEGEGRPGRGGG